MPDAPYLSIVMPAFNEARSIGATLAAMRAFLDAQSYPYQVIVAADGDDATPDVVEALRNSWPQLALSAERGRHGKGYGVRRGMRLATGQIQGFVDADDKTPIADVDRLLPWFGRGYDVVIGSRALPDSRVEVPQPAYRQVGSRVFAFGMHTIVGLRHIHDTQCGFKFFSRAAAIDIFRRTRIDGYMCDVEILSLAQRLGYPVKEVGVRWRDDGDSRLELVRGNARNLTELLRIRFRSGAPRRSPETCPAVATSQQ
ncbi:MAG: glycosyltransferase family 2 protein [Chloroflexi bacterium]|nr:glycosyltransferase family 2 protein [Chloroflexota bacterium]